MMFIQSDTLAPWPVASGSAQLIVFSPPYWGLRDYKVDGQLGLERTHDCLGWATGTRCGKCYVCKTVAYAREAWRVLRDDGVMFVNLGDSYANDAKWGGTTGGKHARGLHGESIGRGKRHTGLKPKELAGIPWAVAFALRADGWCLRQDIVLEKKNPLPESVRDRFTRAHEYIFMLTKSPRYFWDADEISEPAASATIERIKYGYNSAFKGQHAGSPTDKRYKNGREISHPNFGEHGRNPRSVWSLATHPYSGAHFATWPPALVERMVLAASSDKSCPTCGKCWARVGGANTIGFVPACNCYGFEMPDLEFPDQPADVEPPFFCQACSGAGYTKYSDMFGLVDCPCADCAGVGQRAGNTAWEEWNAATQAAQANRLAVLAHVADLALPTRPALVIDPFSGSGTTALVATRLGRRFAGMELNPTYIGLAVARMAQAQVKMNF